MKTADDLLFKVKDSIKNFNPIKEFLLATGCGFACRGGISDNGIGIDEVAASKPTSFPYLQI